MTPQRSVTDGPTWLAQQFNGTKSLALTELEKMILGKFGEHSCHAVRSIDIVIADRWKGYAVNTRSGIDIVLMCLSLLLSTNASNAAHWTTFRDARGFSISYPPHWKADPNFADLNYPDNEGNRARIEGLQLKSLIDLQPHTTLENGQTGLAVEVLPRYANACTAENFLAQQPPDYESGVDKATRTFAHMSGSDPGGWYSYEDFVYLLSRKPCLAVHYFVAYATPGGEVAKDERPFDLGSLLRCFNKIRATIRITHT